MAAAPEADGTQVLVRFVTKLPPELRVPDTEVVSKCRGLHRGCQVCSERPSAVMQQHTNSRSCFVCSLLRAFTGRPRVIETLWVVANHQPLAGARCVDCSATQPWTATRSSAAAAAAFAALVACPWSHESRPKMSSSGVISITFNSIQHACTRSSLTQIHCGRLTF